MAGGAASSGVLECQFGIVKSQAGDLYKVEWQSGSSLFSEGDFVILTTSDGLGQMISPESEEVAEVWVDEIDD